MVKFFLGAVVGVVLSSLLSAASYESRMEEIRSAMEEKCRNEDE